MKTRHYFSKRIIHSLFNENNYNKIKLFKIMLDFKLNREYEISPILPLLIKESDTVFDIGANMGQFACRFSKTVGIAGKVYSFEPVSFNFKSLSRMKSKLKLNNVDIFNIAIGDSNTSGIIKIPLFDNGLVIGTQSTLQKLGNDIKYLEEKIEIRTVDSLVQDFNIPKIDFIKSDTEGNEINVLNGAIETIKKHLPSMYLEINYKAKGLEPFYEMGYIAYHYSKERKLDTIHELQNGDLILIHKSKA